MAKNAQLWNSLNPVNVEALLHVENCQLRWFGHVTRKPQERFGKQVLLAPPAGKRPRGRPRTRWRDYISDLAWFRVGVEPAELSEISVDLEVFRDLPGLLPPAVLPRGKAGMKSESSSSKRSE